MLIYAIKSALTLGLLYLPYLLMLRKEDFFRFNRYTPVFIMVVSLVLPLCNIPAISLDNNPVVHAAQAQMISVGIPIAHSATDGTDDGIYTDGVSWFRLATIIYMCMVLALAITRIYGIVRLRRAIRGNCLWSRRLSNGIMLYCHEDDTPPFSWGNNIVISKRDYDENGREIIMHETGHIINGHSIDVMLLCLCQTLQWFNPLVWLMGQSLSDVHEYEADDYVLAGGIDARSYQMLIIKKAVGSSSYTFANNFNHSLTKKRITMMCKKKSNPWMRAKVMYVIPVATFALCAFATPESKNITDAANVPEASYMAAKPKKVVDSIATFPGGEAAMQKFMCDNIHYPQIAQAAGVQGRVMVQIEIDKNGKVTVTDATFKELSAKEGETGTGEPNQEAVNAMIEEAKRVIGKMPLWNPATDKGKPVKFSFTIPITFRLQ